MAGRYFNWKLAIVLLIGVIALGITAFGLRQWQRSTRAEEGLRLGNEAFETQNWEEAAKQFGRYVGVKRDDVEALTKYAQAHLKIRPIRQTNVRHAIGAYRTILREDPNNAETVVQLADLYLRVTDMAGEAELITSRYLETARDTQVQLALASSLAAQRRFAEAAEQFRAVIGEDPNLVEAYEMLGLLTEQQPEEFGGAAEQWYDQAIHNNPSSALAYVARADHHLRRGDKPEALEDLMDARNLGPKDATVNIRLAVSLWNAGHRDKAEEQLKKAEILDPANSGLWLAWAQTALASGSQEKMVGVAHTGLEKLSAQPWDFMPTAAELFVRGGDIDRAKECIGKLRNKDVSPGTVAFLEGLIAELAGDNTEAAKLWNRALELGNDSPAVRLGLSSVSARMRDIPAAIRQLKVLIGAQPAYVPARLALARIMAQTGHWNGVLEHSRAALKQAPDNIEATQLEIQAMIRLQASENTANTGTWNDVEQKLANLAQHAEDSIEVKLLSLEMAMLRTDLSEASDVVDMLKKSHPADARTAIAEAQVLLAQEKRSEAILVLDAALDKFPQAVELPIFLATLLEHEDTRQECEQMLTDSMEHIEDPLARRDMGIILAEYLRLWDKTDNSFELLKDISNTLPNDISVRRRLLRCQKVIKNPAEAQEIVDQIRSIEGSDGWQWRYEQAKLWFMSDRSPTPNPDDQNSRLLLAAAYDKNEQRQAAIATYREALERSPDDVRIIAAIVLDLYRETEWAEADEILDKAFQRKLDHSTLARLQLAGYLRRGQLDSASDVLQDFVSSDPNDISAGLALALLDMRLTKYSEAAQRLTDLRAKDPNSIELIVTQIQLHVYQGRGEDALALCNEVIRDQNDASAYTLRGQTHTSLGHIAEAEHDFVTATRMEPQNSQTWEAKSKFHVAADQPDKAISAVQQALSLAPEDTDVQLLAISLLLASGTQERFEEAHILLQKALDNDPNNNNFRLLQARSLLLEGTDSAEDKAKRVLRSIADAQPGSATAWALLGQIELDHERPGAAMDIALQGLVHNQNNRELLLLKARAEQSRSPALSIPTYEHLLTLDPNDYGAALLLADVYMAVDNPSKSEELIRRYRAQIEDAQNRRQFSIALAVVMFKSDRSSEARQEVEAALEGTQKDTQTLVALSNAIAATFQPEAQQLAEKLLRDAVAKEPKSASALISLAVLYQLTDKSAEAAELYERVLQIQPNNSVAMNNLAWIVCEDRQDPDGGLKLAERALALDPPNLIDVLDTRGVAYYRLGLFTDAVSDFERCIELAAQKRTGSSTHHFHFARALAKLGETEAALRHLDQALHPASPADRLSSSQTNEANKLHSALVD